MDDAQRVATAFSLPLPSLSGSETERNLAESIRKNVLIELYKRFTAFGMDWGTIRTVLAKRSDAGWWCEHKEALETAFDVVKVLVED